MSLDTAAWQTRAGLMTGAQFRAYVHTWQTGAPRLELRACHCDTCRNTHPDSEYRPVYTLEYNS